MQYLYHGSCKYFNIIKPFKSNHNIEAVYASPDRDFALCYAGNKWHDGIINQCYYNNQLTLTELAPNIFNTIYNTAGYLYTINDVIDFNPVVESNGRIHKKELYAFHSIKYTNVTKIDNILNEILNNSNIDLYYYPTKPYWWNEYYKRREMNDSRA